MSNAVESVVTSIARGRASEGAQPSVRAIGLAPKEAQFADHLGTELFAPEEVSGTFSATADPALAGVKDLEHASVGGERDAGAVVGAVSGVRKALIATAWPDEERGGLKRSISGPGVKANANADSNGRAAATTAPKVTRLVDRDRDDDQQANGNVNVNANVSANTNADVNVNVNANANANANVNADVELYAWEGARVTRSAPADTPAREKERRRSADGVECDARAVAIAMPVVWLAQQATAFVRPDEELGGVKRSIVGPDVRANANAKSDEKPAATEDPMAKTLEDVDVDQKADATTRADAGAKGNADAPRVGHGHEESSPIFTRHVPTPKDVNATQDVNATPDATAIPSSSKTTIRTTPRSTSAIASGAALASARARARVPASTRASIPALARAPIPSRDDSGPRVPHVGSPRDVATDRDTLPVSDNARGPSVATAPLATSDLLPLAATTGVVLPPPPATVSGSTTVNAPTVIRTAHSDVEATAKAIRNAEAVGHRRVLAGDAHGALTLEDLGRFEVHAHSRDDGRVDVQLRADRREGAAMLDAHAAELRADVRVEVPRAFITVETTTAEAPMGTPTRSNGRESEARDDRAERRAEHGAHLTSEPTTPAREASSNRRSARVRIVL